MMRKIWAAAMIALLLSAMPAAAALSNFDFLALCQNGTGEEIKAAIDGGADVKAVDEAGVNAVGYVAHFNQHPQAAAVLLAAGADPNAKDNDGWTPVMHAAFKNQNLELLTELVKAGADLNVQDGEGRTALMVAVFSECSVDYINALAAGGANLNLQDADGRSALMYAAGMRTPNPENITALLNAGADPMLKNSTGAMAVDYARNNASLQDTETFRMLAEASGETIASADAAPQPAQ